MGVLMLQCSKTGREFSTGIHIDEESYNRLPDTGPRRHVPTAASCIAGGPVRRASATKSSRCIVPADPRW
jgi:hypothetical protein